MPVWPSVTESDPENLRGKSGIAARRFATALEANSAPAAARELRWRKSRRSMVTSMGHQRESLHPIRTRGNSNLLAGENASEESASGNITKKCHGCEKL